MKEVSLVGAWFGVVILVTMICCAFYGPENVGAWYGRFAGGGVRSYHQVVDPVNPMPSRISSVAKKDQP